jgi:PAS domain S-box-containing protein
MEDHEKSKEELLSEVAALRAQVAEFQQLEVKYQKTKDLLADERNLLRVLIDSFPDLIYIKDTDSCFVIGNLAVARLMGADSPNDLVGKSDYDFFPEDVAKPYFDDEQTIIRTQEPLVNREEYTFNNTTQEAGWLLTTKIPYRDQSGHVVGIVGIGRNITELKEAQEKLAQAIENAETASRTKSEFLANMSHELRTPLNAIIGYSEMLQEDAVEQGYNDLLPDLKRIWSAGKHLLSLINDVLDLSKIEAGKMEVYSEEVILPTLIWEVQSVAQTLMEKNQNTLLVEADDNLGKIVVDVTKLRQILLNLLSNAAKFTESGQVTLSVWREFIGAERIVFQVKDTGIGMTPEQAEKLFASFSQADASTTRKYGGTGLGLAITQRFCQMMGGHIEVQSTKDVGSTFTVRLPVNYSPNTILGEAELAELVAQGVLPTNDGITVLIIDDDPVARDLLSRALTKEGNVRIIAAENGQDGVRLAREAKPDIITLDILMPSMDGWAVLTKLKADPETADIPVIIASMVQDKNIGYSLGAADFLSKPIDRQHLHGLLSKYSPSGKALSALVIEDDPAIREILKMTLEHEGWEVGEAEDGYEALEQIELHQPHLIILDLMLPRMDGFQFLSELRKNPQWQFIPVIVVTAMGLTQAHYERLKGSVTNILLKAAYSQDALVDEVVKKVQSHSSTSKQRQNS